MFNDRLLVPRRKITTEPLEKGSVTKEKVMYVQQDNIKQQG